MDSARAAKLIRMLSTSHDGEVINAARALCRLGIHEVARAVESPIDPIATFIRNRAPEREQQAQQELSRLKRQIRKLEDRLVKFNKFATRACRVCEREFAVARQDAVTCSARCRVKLHRRNRGNT